LNDNISIDVDQEKMSTKTLTSFLEDTTFIENSIYRSGYPALPTSTRPAGGGGTGLKRRLN
jgi:hypothetical protein